MRKAVASKVPTTREVVHGGNLFVSHCIPCAEGGAIIRFRACPAGTPTSEIRSAFLQFKSKEKGRDAAPVVLSATAAETQGRVREWLEPDLQVLYAATFQDAERKLKGSKKIDLVLVGVHFDESRMFDLMRYCTKHYPRLPIVCCRLLATDVSPIFIEALRVAVESSGASLLDLPAIAKAAGAEAARFALRNEVLCRVPIAVPMGFAIDLSEDATQ